MRLRPENQGTNTARMSLAEQGRRRVRPASVWLQTPHHRRPNLGRRSARGRTGLAGVVSPVPGGRLVLARRVGNPVGVNGGPTLNGSSQEFSLSRVAPSEP